MLTRFDNAAHQLYCHGANRVFLTTCAFPLPLSEHGIIGRKLDSFLCWCAQNVLMQLEKISVTNSTSCFSKNNFEMKVSVFTMLNTWQRKNNLDKQRGALFLLFVVLEFIIRVGQNSGYQVISGYACVLSVQFCEFLYLIFETKHTCNMLPRKGH